MQTQYVLQYTMHVRAARAADALFHDARQLATPTARNERPVTVSCDHTEINVYCPPREPQPVNDSEQGGREGGRQHEPKASVRSAPCC